MGLDEYNRKRHFDRTPEPHGEEGKASGGGARFVVQKHDASRLHYDFRLELDGVLKSWAVPKGPSLDPATKRLAMHVEDHPLEYGDFEGVIPKGEYGGGTVMLWDAGTWKAEGDAEKAYRKGHLRFTLDGEKLRGRWNLVHMHGRDEGDKQSWLLIKDADDAATPGDEEGIVRARPESVATGRTLEEIAADRDRVWHSDRSGNDGGEESSPSKRTSRGAASSRGSKSRDRASVKRGDGKGGAMADVASLAGARPGTLPPEFQPQLATLVTQAPEGDDWLHEIKLDGYRILCRIEDGAVRLISRNAKDWTKRYPEVAEAASALPCTTALLDGEVVVLNARGISDFQALQKALGEPSGRRQLHYYAFDLLHLDGYDLTRVPLRERKPVLQALLGPADDVLRYADHVLGQGRLFHKQACGMGLEGIISKRAAGAYQTGRSRDWLKIKCLLSQEFAVVGYTDPGGSRIGFGALLLAVNDDAGALVYAGRVGTGFDDRTLRELHERLRKLERKTPAVSGAPGGARERDVHWVDPTLVAEVAFAEWTHEGVVRHPSFQGLREDKSAADVVREAPVMTGKAQASAKRAIPAAGGKEATKPGTKTARGGTESSKSADGTRATASRKRTRGAGSDPIAGVRLTNPDRVMYAEDDITKREVAEYYEAIADHMLPHVLQRPLTLVRCPSGAGEKCFYQKHANESVPDNIPRVEVEEHDETAQYLMVDGLPAIIRLVQLGVLEFHVGGARADRLDRPDRLVLDLDPDTELPWTRVVEAAFDLRDRLAGIGLTTFAKTTGGKGLHVVIPIARRTDWDEARAFTHAVAEGYARREPARFTATMSKSSRAGKIYIDYVRNGRSATAIATYSTRARPGAPVAVPLAWEELEGSTSRPVFTVNDVPARIAGLETDPWAGIDDVNQSITKAMVAAVSRKRR